MGVAVGGGVERDGNAPPSRARQRKAAKTKSGGGSTTAAAKAGGGPTTTAAAEEANQEEIFFDDEPDIGKTLHAKDGKVRSREFGFISHVVTYFPARFLHQQQRVPICNQFLG